MREFLGFNIVVDIMSLLSKKSKKLKKALTAFSLAWTFFGIISIIWSLIPKDEEMPEITPEILLEELKSDEQLKADQAESENSLHIIKPLFDDEK